jgi:hypothetical protein
MEWLAPPSYQQWAACQSFHLVVVEVLNADLIDVLTIRKEACHAIRSGAEFDGLRPNGLPISRAATDRSGRHSSQIQVSKSARSCSPPSGVGYSALLGRMNCYGFAMRYLAVR